MRRMSAGVALSIAVWIALALSPAALDPWAASQLAQYMTYGLFAMSLAFIWGQGGILCFGHALFFGIGAYAMALVTLGRLPWLGGQSVDRTAARDRRGRVRRQPARAAAVPWTGPLGRLLRHRHPLHGVHRRDRGAALALRRWIQRSHRGAAVRGPLAIGRGRVPWSARNVLRHLRRRPRGLSRVASHRALTLRDRVPGHPRQRASHRLLRLQRDRIQDGGLHRLRCRGGAGRGSLHRTVRLRLAGLDRLCVVDRGADLDCGGGARHSAGRIPRRRARALRRRACCPRTWETIGC